MLRTNIYLSEAQDRALRQRALFEGTTKSAVVRKILDESLGSGPVGDELSAGFEALATGWDQLTDGLFDDDPDIRIEP